MSRPARRLIFYPLLAAFAAASAVWFLHVPRRTDRLAWTVPAGARWVSLHRGLAGRWAAIAANPLAFEAARLAGISSQEWIAVRADETLTSWMRRLAGDEVLIAQFPVGPGRRAWGAASWIGGRAQRLRGLLNVGAMPGIRRLCDHRGRPVWLAGGRVLPDAPHLSFALEEGMIVACLSDHPADILRMLDAYDGMTPRDPEAELLHARPLAGFDTGFWDLGTGPGPDRIEIGLTRFDAASISGTVILSGWEIPLPVPASSVYDLSGAAAVLGAHPAGVAVVPAGVAEALAQPLWRRPWMSWMWGAARQRAGDPLVIGLHGDALSGRFMGMRIPGLTISMPVRDPAAFPAALDPVLDRLNAETRWGLIRASVPGAPELSMIEGTGAGPYAGLPPNECAAWWTTNGWLTIAASADTLRALSAAAAAGTPVGAAPWAARPGLAGNAGWAWFDLARTCETLRLSLSVWSLKLQVEDRDGSAARRAQLAAAREALAAFGTLGTAMCGLDATDGVLTIRFQAGGSSHEETLP
ncbi:MAG: hypothetical protein BWK77_01750 [Verrucomicrobia bacterium A1]|nr:MAG: hypothetical protein BWK77_01750 [Verrucomicrobia bacterium A1]